MKLSDISNGPDWVLWVVIILFAALSVLFLSGRGSWLIAGYNTASKEEKAKYNTKKLCRVFGAGMTAITLQVSLKMYCQQNLHTSPPGSFWRTPSL